MMYVIEIYTPQRLCSLYQHYGYSTEELKEDIAKCFFNKNKADIFSSFQLFKHDIKMMAEKTNGLFSLEECERDCEEVKLMTTDRSDKIKEICKEIVSVFSPKDKDITVTFF